MTKCSTPGGRVRMKKGSTSLRGSPPAGLIRTMRRAPSTPGDTVARDFPAVGERVGRPDPAVRREDGQAARLARGGDLRLLLHEHRAGKPSGQGVGVLIHPEHGHPVGRVFADLHPPEHGANRLRERPAAGHDDEPTPRAEGCERLDDEIERARFAQQSAADLHHRMDDPRLVRHAGTGFVASSVASSSATAAAGAWRAAGPSAAARCATRRAARRAASAARKSPRPVTTASVSAG